MAVGVEKFPQFLYLSCKLLPPVSVSYSHSVRVKFYETVYGNDVGAVLHSLISRGEWLMLHKLKATAMVYESIPGYAGGGMIRL